MTESHDDKVLDDYLSRDSAVSRAYRNMDTAEIPSAVDAAVLAQARAAVDRQQSKRRPAWTRWTAPVALAASVVIGVSVLLESGVEEKVYYPTGTRVQEAPQDLELRDATAAEAIEQVKEQPAIAPSTRASAPAPIDAAKQSQLKAERALARRKQDERADAAPAGGTAFKPNAAPIPEAEPPPPVAAEQPVEITETASTGAAQPFEADKLEKKVMEEERPPASLYSRTRAEPQRMPAPAAPQAMADRQVGQLSNAVAAPRLSSEAWLEQIRTLRREGKVLEADEQWRRFVDAYPEVVVPENDFARPKPLEKRLQPTPPPP